MSDANAATPSPSRLSLKRRLILVVLLVSLLPLLLSMGIAAHLAKGSFEQAAFDKLVAVRSARANHILDTYRTIEAQVIELAASCTAKDGLQELGEGMRALPEDLGWSPEDAASARESLQGYYDDTVAEKYRGVTGKDLATGGIVPEDARAVAAQMIFLVDNPHPVGSKAQLVSPPGAETRYGARHPDHHVVLRDFMERFGYYDVFLIDPEGLVVYSVTKEVDFATNLLTGPYKDTGLAEAALQALESRDPDQAFLTDYMAYPPSYDEPAAFIAAPVMRDRKTVGALVFQMPISRIDEVMSSAAGLGETGETYLVGKDGLMRSNSRFEDTSSILRVRVDSEAVRSVFEGKTGQGLIEDYRGESVLSAWEPLNLVNLDYALIAEVDQEETDAPADRIRRSLLILAIVLAAVAVAISVWVASSLAAPVGAATEKLDGLAQHLLSESQEQQAGAAEQSAAVEETRQTFTGLLDASANLNRIGTDVLGHAEISQRSAQTIGDRIQELSTSATTIEEVLALVKEIANKTDILALNAALEGTKAGEAGRGFSLVAQQMQRLAAQVMDSVKKIEGLTSEISQSSRSAVLAAEEADRVSRLTTDAARDISSAVSLQQSSAEQVSVAMTEIAQVAGRNVDAARHVVTSSNDLLKLAERLREIVGVRG